MGKKATNAVVADRVAEVQRLLLTGRTRTHILQYCATHGIEARQADIYVARAWGIIKEINNLTLEENVAQISGALWDIFEKANAAGDTANALKAIAQLSKIRGLETLTLNVRTEPRELEEVNDETVDEVLEAEYEPV